MNPRRAGRWDVVFTNPVTGEECTAPVVSPMGRAAMAGDVTEVTRLHDLAEREWARIQRREEIRGNSGRRSAWATIAAHAADHGREFRVLLMAVAP